MPAPPPDDDPWPQLVLCDAFDREAFAVQVARSPELGEQLRVGQVLFGGFEALGQDVFCALFKYNVQLAPEGAGRRAREALGRRVLGWLLSHPDLALLRAATTLEAPRSAFATLRVLKIVHGMLTQHGAASRGALGRELETTQLEAELEALEEQRAALDALLESGAELDAEAAEAAGAGLDEEIEEARRALAARLREQARWLDKMPTSSESALRELVRRLPERLEQAEARLRELGLNLGGMAEADSAAALELGDELAHNTKLQQLARLVGAFRDYARALRARKLERRPAEVHDVVRGDDLARVLPVERALLADPTLRLDVLRRLVERQLLQYAITGEDKAGRGPLVVCLDGSGSMAGAKEVWAKAIALTLLDIARRERRHLRVVVFSGAQSQLRVFDLLQAPRRGALQAPPPEPAAVLDFARYFPNGGTDFEGPLDKALELLQEKALRRGDVVLITDGEAHVAPRWLERFLAEKRRLDFAVYAVLVDVGGARLRDDTVRPFADRITSVSQLTADQVRELFLKV